MRYRLIALVAIGLCIGAAALVLPLSALAGAPSPNHANMDDSRFPHTWRPKGNPQNGVLVDPRGNSGYYYLNLTTAGSVVHARMWTNSGSWRVDFDLGFNHTPLFSRVMQTTPDEVMFPNAPSGRFMRVRFAHLSGPVAADHASAYTSDSCAMVPPATATATVADTARCGPDAGSAAAPPAPPAPAQPAPAQPAPAPAGVAHRKHH